MNTVENNLFKLILAGVLSMGVLTMIPVKTNKNSVVEKVTVINVAQTEVNVAQNLKPIPQVIIVGKRINKSSVLLASK